MHQNRIIPVLLLAALLVANHVHLPVLQVVAWCGMLVSYSRNNSTTEAIEMTFDGDHPCPMCKTIKKAQAATAENDRLTRPQERQAREIGFWPILAGTCAAPSFTHQRVAAAPHRSPEARVCPPPTPPPISA